MAGEGRGQKQEGWLGNYCNNPGGAGGLAPSGAAEVWHMVELWVSCEARGMVVC